MSLGDDLAWELPYLQAEAESMMKDTCTIRRKTGTRYNEDTGRTEETYQLVYEGKCRLRQVGGAAGGHQTGRMEWSQQGTTLSIPVSAAGAARTDDIATVTASTLAPYLVGREYVLQQTPGTTYATAARYDCREVTW